MRRPRDPAVPFILVVLFLDTLGIGLIIPVLPGLVRSLVGDSGATALYYGAFGAVYAAVQFVVAPILGGLSDRFGRRPVILASLAGAALDYLLLALAPGLGWLFVGRVIAGITGANFAAATAYIADVTPRERRGQSFGLAGAAFSLGFIVGPALGGLLGHFHARLPFVVAAGLNLVNFLYGCFVLPESLRRENRRPFSLRRTNPFASLLRLGRHPIALGLAGTLLCGHLAQQILQAVWALSADARFGWKAGEIGAGLALVGLAGALVQGGLVRAALPRLGERRALVVGLCFSVFGFTAFGAATRGWMLYAIILPSSLGRLAAPAIQSLISREVGPSEQGELQGALASLVSVAAIFGPLIGTGLLRVFSAADAPIYLPGAPFFMGACLNACGLLFAVRLFARRPAPASSAAGPG